MNAHVPTPKTIDAIEDELQERRRGQGDITGRADWQAMADVEFVWTRTTADRNGRPRR